MMELTEDLTQQIIAWRRTIHQHPELGFQETCTASLVVGELERLGYRVRTGVGRTGVIGEIGHGKPVIAIRADMDALPIQEANQTSYASSVPGVMHACGHDAHTAMALGAAALLARKEFNGTVRFLFQPSEEMDDEEGLSGAPRMIQDGAMEDVSAALALHVDPAIPVGSIAVGDGPSSAGIDSLYASILGRGGHGAFPHTAVDPIYISAHVLLALHGIVSRRLHPLEPAVLSIGSIHGGNAGNVIPDRVEITGTIRYMSPLIQKQIHDEIQRALDVARALGGDYQYRIDKGYPPMYNKIEMVDLIRRAAEKVIDPSNIVLPDRHMGAEDFGFFSHLAPGAMFTLGARLENDVRELHSPNFDIDERCLPVGSSILAKAALLYLDHDD